MRHDSTYLMPPYFVLIRRMPESGGRDDPDRRLGEHYRRRPLREATSQLEASGFPGEGPHQRPAHLRG